MGGINNFNNSVELAMGISLTNNEGGLLIIPYPPWCRLPRASELFAVGEETIRRWADQGLILRRSNNTSVQYRAKDIDRILESEARGIKPRRAI